MDLLLLLIYWQRTQNIYIYIYIYISDASMAGGSEKNRGPLFYGVRALSGSEPPHY